MKINHNLYSNLAYNLAVKNLGKTKTKILVNLQNLKSMTREARLHMSNNNINKTRHAIALLTNTLASHIIVNLCLTVYKPLTPTKMFTNKKNAFDWLQQFPNQ